MKQKTKPKSKRAPARAPVPSLYLKSVSSYFSSKHSARELRDQQRRLTEGLKKTRTLYRGFSAAQGYDLRYLKHWPGARVEELLTYLGDVNRLTSGESYELHKLVVPRTRAERNALRAHTSQVSRDEERHAQRAFVIYPNEPKGVRIRYVEEQELVAAPMGRPVIRHRLRVEQQEQVAGNVRLIRNYLFREVLGFQPGLDSTTPEGLRIGRLLRTFDPWVQMIIAMRALVTRLPMYAESGEEAQYRLLTDRGPIGARVPRHMLIKEMQRWGEQYDPRFVGMLIGVRWLGTETQARQLMIEANERQRRYQRLAYEQHLARSRVRYDGTLLPLHTPRKKKRKALQIKKRKRVVKRPAARKPKKSRKPTRHK